MKRPSSTAHWSRFNIFHLTFFFLKRSKSGNASSAPLDSASTRMDRCRQIIYWKQWTIVCAESARFQLVLKLNNGPETWFGIGCNAPPLCSSCAHPWPIAVDEIFHFSYKKKKTVQVGKCVGNLND